jgi:hypothetical protein
MVFMAEINKMKKQFQDSVTLYKESMRRANNKLEHAMFPEYIHESSIGVMHLGNAILELNAEYIVRLNQLAQRLTIAAERLESREAYVPAAHYREMCGDLFLGAGVFLKDEAVPKAVKSFLQAISDYRKASTNIVYFSGPERSDLEHFQNKICAIEKKINQFMRKCESD